MSWPSPRYQSSSFADMLNIQRYRVTQSCYSAVQYAKKGPTTSNDREPINVNNDDAQCEAHQKKNVIDNTQKDSSISSVGSTIALQPEDRRPWMHRVIEEGNGSGYKGWSYIILVIKTGRLITWNIKGINSTPVIIKQYLHKYIRQLVNLRTYSCMQYH